MSRRDPRWQVTYLLRGSPAQWMVRAPDRAGAIEAARAERAAWDTERGNPAESSFEIAFAIPYTNSDAMDDGTSWVSWALAVTLPVLLVLALVGRAGGGGVPGAVAGFGWWVLQVMVSVGFVGWLLYGAAMLIYASVTVLRERSKDRREGV